MLAAQAGNEAGVCRKPATVATFDPRPDAGLATGSLGCDDIGRSTARKNRPERPSDARAASAGFATKGFIEC
jgi:hypothetical protein